MKDDIITLSVVIPCYNEVNTLAACLDRVLGIQEETLRLEVIAVDDTFTDGTLPSPRVWHRHTLGSSNHSQYQELR